MMLRPLSVDEIWKGVTRSATGVSPATSRSRGGIGCVTTSAEAVWTDGIAVGASDVPDTRPQAARMSDPPIATPALTRFIRSPQVSPFQVGAAPTSRLPSTASKLRWAIDELQGDLRRSGTCSPGGCETRPDCQPKGSRCVGRPHPSCPQRMDLLGTLAEES